MFFRPTLISRPKRPKIGFVWHNGAWGQARNPSIETRNKPEERKPQIPNAAPARRQRFEHCPFRAWHLFGISSFPCLRRDKLGPAKAGLLRIWRIRTATAVRSRAELGLFFDPTLIYSPKTPQIGFVSHKRVHRTCPFGAKRPLGGPAVGKHVCVAAHDPKALFQLISAVGSMMFTLIP